MFCRYGENTPLLKAIDQLQLICERGGSEANLFDIFTDCKLDATDWLSFNSKQTSSMYVAAFLSGDHVLKRFLFRFGISSPACARRKQGKIKFKPGR